MLNIEEIKAREQAATPGPWEWDVAPCNQEIELVTAHSGKYYVMGFERWGMQNAAPTFQIYKKYSGPIMERESIGMVRADKLAKSIPGMEHHVGFDDYIDHPDATFIASARAWVPALCDEVERLRKECDELKKALEEYKNAYPDFYEIAVHNAKIGNEQAREARKDG